MDSVDRARREEGGVDDGRLAAGMDALLFGRAIAIAAAWGGVLAFCCHYACWSVFMFHVKELVGRDGRCRR